MRAPYKRSQQIAYPGRHPACLLKNSSSQEELREVHIATWWIFGLAHGPMAFCGPTPPHATHAPFAKPHVVKLLQAFGSPHTGHVSSPWCPVNRVWMQLDSREGGGQLHVHQRHFQASFVISGGW